MTTPQEELRDVADSLDALAKEFKDPQVEALLSPLEEAANQVSKAWSGSWFGYQSCVYFADLKPPPPGAHFSSEWGLMGRFQGTTGDWREYNFDQIREHIFHLAGDPDLTHAKELAQQGRRILEEKRDQVLSLLESMPSSGMDTFLERLLEDVRSTKIFLASDYIAAQRPSGQLMSRDSLALTQGLMPAPHITVLAEIFEIRYVGSLSERLHGIVLKVASHMDRRARAAARNARVGTNIFIGHGRSPIWKDLKEFIQDRLRLPWDEFNRVPVAGITNIARLSEMLDDAAIAFIVLTAEDEQVDGSLHARMNAIHEAGLFQGRLGFGRSIVLLEEGCEEFSNIHGLGQIRFPKGNIGAAFEEVRRVLERERMIEE